MGNFLENLAVRSLQPVASEATRLFQPRLPSLFESPSRTEDSIAAPIADRQVEAKAETHEPESERNTARIPEKIKSPPILVEPQRTILEHVDAEPTVSAQPSAEASRLPEREGKRSALQSKENPTYEVKARINLLSDERESRKVADSRTSIERGVVPEIQIGKSKSESKPTLAPLLIPTTARVQDSTLEQTAARETEVHIHIGRIDVRAVTPSQNPVTRVVPQKPRLSLDDYLRQRDEGER